MKYQLIESPADRLRDYLLYHVEWICACFFLVLIILLLAGQVVGQNDHIRELESIVNEKGVACKDLLDDPVVQRIMSAR